MISRMKNRIAGGFTLIELMVVVAIIGILAAVAIPAFMKNAKKAKTTEAVINVKKLADGAISYYHEEKNAAGAVVPLAKQFPAAPAVNTAPALGTCCTNAAVGKCTPDPQLWVDPTWQALKFSMDDPHYFSYRYVRNAAGASTATAPTVNDGQGGTATATEWFYADAHGDLNCDAAGGGFYSTYEMLGAIQGDLSVTTGGGMYKDRELD